MEARYRSVWSQACCDCGERETVAHLFLSCSALSTHREALARAFKQLGLPSATVDDILHPVGSAHRVRPALRAVLNYIEAAELADRLL
ncbi:hypothetical protein HPB52_016465 [Rhipicephalus sanguineus]|uniref:Tick transposon n=1 Tax=Rhipicephalus sanguineus TaxID=34632 RepID=A0A9D4PWY3_RHISA|nr:hypothetical protein HPB52_016465 [Rhipicephalus sanguineus]